MEDWEVQNLIVKYERLLKKCKRQKLSISKLEHSRTDLRNEIARLHKKLDLFRRIEDKKNEV